jgi:hypothetical protein
MLDEIGFFKLLAIKDSPQKKKAGQVEAVQFMTGDMVSGDDALKLAQTLADMVFGDVEDNAEEAIISARMTVYAALIEAIENTILHAYEEVPGNMSVTRWWMSGSVDRAQRHINVVVYDQGLSIPATLPHWDQYGWVDRHLARFRARAKVWNDGIEDAAKLRLAMKVPLSSTGLKNRGKGFPAFKEVLTACRKGKLRIVSRRGEFLLESGKRPTGRSLNLPLRGTLVEWDLWL